MRTTDTRSRLGALSLGGGALLLALFPLVRPYFPLDPRAPVATLDVASPAIASRAWVLAHGLATAGFVLLALGLLAVYARLATHGQEPRARRGLVLSLAGIALVMPTLGVETYVLPAIARMYLAGTADVAPLIGAIYIGPTTWVMALGLALLAIGAISLARAIRKSSALPGWAGIVFAVGLVFWLPLLPPPVRIVDGLLIGLGGLGLAWGLWTPDAAGQHQG